MATYNVELRQRISGTFGDTIYLKANWSNIDNKPFTFTPTAHTHVLADITDLSISLPSGPGKDTEFLNGYGEWETPPDTQLSNAQVIAKVLTSFTPYSYASTIAAADSIFTAFRKLEYRVALNDAKADDNAVVKLSGNQSIIGTKNFTGTLQFGGKTVATLDDITSVFKYKGSVASYANLPSTGQVIGDVWNVLDTGKNFAWDGTAWDDLSGIIDLSNYYTKSETDSLFDDKVDKITDKGLSTNDLTNTLKSNYDTAYTHSQSTHAPSNAQKNSDITKTEIEAKLTGEISSHSHALPAHTHTKSQITDFPTSMTPTAHNHDSDYYKKTEIDTMIGDIDTILDSILGV